MNEFSSESRGGGGAVGGMCSGSWRRPHTPDASTCRPAKLIYLETSRQSQPWDGSLPRFSLPGLGVQRQSRYHDWLLMLPPDTPPRRSSQLEGPGCPWLSAQAKGQRTELPR